MADVDPRASSKRDAEALERIAAAGEADAIERALVAARERLGMEAAYVTTVNAERQRVTDLAGDASALGCTIGTELAIEDTYCARMLRGELPNVVPDTSNEPAVRGLAVTERVRSYVGVPITLSDGSIHGTLCAASSEARGDLGDEELAFMRVLADMMARRIEKAREFVDRLNGQSPKP